MHNRKIHYSDLATTSGGGEAAIKTMPLDASPIVNCCCLCSQRSHFFHGKNLPARNSNWHALSCSTTPLNQFNDALERIVRKRTKRQRNGWRRFLYQGDEAGRRLEFILMRYWETRVINFPIMNFFKIL